MTFDPELLRRAMRAWTTGVAILTAAHDGETYGMTINSFNSISLEPPIVCVTVQNTTHIHRLIEGSQTFGVTILAARQTELAVDFAGRKHARERMDGIQMQTFATGAPILTDGLASLDCRVTQTIPLGRNTLFLAEVAAVQVQSSDHPLIYHDRSYHQIA
jgi:3-hydroxy-9,10-secoandrosta-1,3,5(10)-triene-9,17-dione monooxygenase reductase component